jgi:general secretion pathway protein L
MAELRHGIAAAPADAAGDWRWRFNGVTGHGDLLALRQAAAAAPFHLLVPGEACLLTQVELPVRNPRELERALPFALEDRLVEDIDTLHFAAGEPQGEAGRRPVAVVSRSLARAWLDALRTVGLRPAALVPDTLTLPVEPGCWAVALEGDRLRVRSGAGSGVAFELTAAPLLLERLLREQGVPDTVRVFGEGEGLAAIEAFAARHSLSLIREPGPFDALEQARQQLAAGVPLDLRQGRLREESAAPRRLWALAALLALFACILQVSDLLLRTQQLQRLTADLEDRAQTSFRAIFPAVGRVVNLRAQAEQELAALGTGGGNRADFLGLLARCGPVFASGGQARLITLDFRAGRLEVDVEAGDMRAVETVQQALRETGLVVELVSADARPDGVFSRLRLSVAGS